MTTDIQTRDNMAVGIAGTSGEADPSDFSIPYVTLIQASSEAVKDGKCKPGIFQSSDGEQYEAIDMVPLHIAFTRDFYDANNAKSICGSSDRVTGYPRDLTFFRTMGNIDVSEGIPLACKECPFFDEPAGPKLACKKGYTVTAYDVNKEAPFMLRVRGTAVNVFKHRFVGAVAMGRSVPWARQFQLTSKKVASGGNSWFAPELEPTKGFDATECMAWENYASGLVAPSAVEHVDADDLPFE